MNRKLSLNAAGLALLALGPGSAPAAESASCDRNCLLGVLSDYEARLLRHDASGIATSATFRATENYLPIKLGEGYWTRVREILDQQQFADVQNGQAMALGLLDDGGKDAYFALRLKVQGKHRIAQSEMLLIRDGETSFLQKDRSVKLSSVYSEIVPAAQRSTRAELIRAVENFSDAWQYKDGDLMSFSDDCTFSENNVQLSQPGYTSCGHMLEYNGKRGIPGAGTSPERGDPGAPTRPMTPADPSIGRPPLQGPWIRDRRYPVVDVERGLVIAYHIQGGWPARAGETIRYRRKTPFIASSESHRRTAEENAQMLSAAPKAGQGAAPAGPPAGAPREQGAAYMVGLFKIVGGKLTRIDHFEWEGGPNASGGFADGPKF
ncbi:MAG: hypothetical protein QM718_00380 [Steroidobacteraceae bacterium]